MARKRKPTDIVQVNLRITEEMRRDLLARAEESSSSFNGELVELIRQGMGKPGLSEMIVREIVERMVPAVVEREKLREELRQELLKESQVKEDQRAEEERRRRSAAALIMEVINTALRPYVHGDPNQQVPPQVLAQVHHNLGEALALLESKLDTDDGELKK
jgi:hypothetical protein